MSSGDADAKIPALVQAWRAVYLSVPPLNAPSTEISFSFALASAVVLCVVRVVAEIVLVSVFNWPAGAVPTKEAAACLTSIFHSSNLCPGLIVALWSHKYDPAEKMDDAPVWWQQHVDALLQFCTGYMIYDAVVNILYLRWSTGAPGLTFDDKLFLFHHMITSAYMTSTRIIRAGHMSAMMCMLLGEITNPLHNSYGLAEQAIKLDCCNGPVARARHAMIEFAFAVMYNLVRVVVAPPIFVHMTYRLSFSEQAKANIPLSLRISWNIMVWTVVFGSATWIAKCHGIIMANLAGGEGDKEL